MTAIKVTTKRQATLPAALCEELGIGPGDTIDVDRRTVGGETVWVLRGRKPDWSWLGGARHYAKGKSHDWTAIKRSIAQGWADEDR